MKKMMIIFITVLISAQVFGQGIGAGGTIRSLYREYIELNELIEDFTILDNKIETEASMLSSSGTLTTSALKETELYSSWFETKTMTSRAFNRIRTADLSIIAYNEFVENHSKYQVFKDTLKAAINSASALVSSVQKGDCGCPKPTKKEPPSLIFSIGTQVLTQDGNSDDELFALFISSNLVGATFGKLVGALGDYQIFYQKMCQLTSQFQLAHLTRNFVAPLCQVRV